MIRSVPGYISASKTPPSVFIAMKFKELSEKKREGILFNPLALELDIYSLAHHLCKM